MEPKGLEQIALERIGEVVRVGWTEIGLGSLELIELPKEIGELIILRRLILSHNKLTSLPSEIGNLKYLEELSAPHNEISELPIETGQLSRLTQLIIPQNKLIELPTEIGKLNNLKVLNVRENRLTKLPAEIGKLKNLTSIDISCNNLQVLPAEIGRLENLKELSASNLAWDGSREGNNNITELPSEIRQLKKLEILDLRGNPLSIPPEILEKYDEPYTILNYYFSVFKVNAPGEMIPVEKEAAAVQIGRRLNEIKLLVVGQGSVGKTSLVQRVVHDTFDQNQNKTEGISISQWLIDDDQSKVENQQLQIKLNIWDFGGQEILHATHQFFLTKRSLYLLVLDARLTQEENRVEYWLKIIQSFGGESPVLIVGSKSDQHPLDIDRTGLRKKYPNVVGILDTSAATGAGISELRHIIAKQVDNIPHVRDLLPETWFAVKTRLESLGRDKNYLTHDEYLLLCQDNEVVDDLSQHTLIGFLHDLGVVLHFQDDPRLEALGILNPQWVTNGVYKILNAYTLFQNKGVLTLSMLNSILNFPEYPRDKRLFILDMMKKFELCYDMNDYRFLVPDLLPKDEPYTGNWYEALAFQYHYNILPSSIITRFIVRMNTFVYKTVWRSGVVLRSGSEVLRGRGNTALVKADTEDRKIYIWVSGDENTRRDFLSAIRAEFDSIHKTIAKIEAREKVPVPRRSNIVVDYEHLLTLERKGIAEFIPEGMDEAVNAKELLRGVTVEIDRRAGEQYGAIEFTQKPNLSISTISPTETERPLKLATIIKAAIIYPRYVGQFLLDVLGRHDSAESSSIIMGWLLIFVFILVLQGFINYDGVIKFFTDIWQFFNSIK